MSASLRKSFTDLTRRKARTFFTVLTLVAGGGERRHLRRAVGHAAGDGARGRRQQERRRDRLVRAAEAQRRRPRRARRLPNVAAVEPRSSFVTRVWVGERRAAGDRRRRARLRRTSASTSSPSAPVSRPRAGAVLTEQNNAERRSFDAPPGMLRGSSPPMERRALPITGVGRNLTDGEDDPSNEWITFYAPRRLSPRSAAAGLHDAGHPAARQPARRRRADGRRGA